MNVRAGHEAVADSKGLLSGTPVTIIAAIEEHARLRGGNIAVRYLVSDADSETIEFAGLVSRARAFAARLASRASAGGRALLIFEGGVDFIVAFLGCLYADVIPVPVATRLSSRFEASVASIVSDAGASLIIVSDEHHQRERSRKALADLGVPVVAASDLDAGVVPGFSEFVSPVRCGDDIAYLQYTSGTTSMPKGVMVSHANLLHNLGLATTAFNLDSETVVVSWLPHYHDMGLIGTILLPLYLGVTTVLMRPEHFIEQPARWLEAISKYRGTLSGGPDFAYDLCATKAQLSAGQDLDLSCWKVAFSGSEPVRASTLQLFDDTFSLYGFHHAAFLPCYGLAEGTLLAAGKSDAHGPTSIAVDSKALTHRQVVEAVGDAQSTDVVGCMMIPDVEIAIVTGDGKRVGEGIIGEIWLRSASVAKGYWGKPELSAEIFAATLEGGPGGNGRYLRTGDLGFRIADHLYICGRQKDVIIIRGANHYPEDIEASIREACDDESLGRVAVFQVSDDPGGAAPICAMYESNDTRPEDVARRERLIRQAAVAGHGLDLDHVLVVPPRSIPITTSGKTRRSMCSQAYANGTLAAFPADSVVAKTISNDVDATSVAIHVPEAPASMPALSSLRAERSNPGFTALRREASNSKAPNSFASRPEVVAGLKSIASDVLACDVDTTKPLALQGLDSLKAIELRHKVEIALGVQLSFEEILTDHTIEDLAEVIVASGGRSMRTAITSEPDLGADASASFPLSYGQRMLWFQSQVAQDPATLNLPRAVAFSGQLDVEKLAAALESIVDSHGALRTTLTTTGSGVDQVVTSQEWHLDVRDSLGGTDAELKVLLDEEAYRPFEIAGGSLFRAVLFRQTPARNVLLLVAHHTVMDVWSLGVVVNELSARYEGPRLDSGMPSSDAHAHPREFVEWQQQILDGDSAADLQTFWVNAIGQSPALDLPLDHHRRPTRGFRGADYQFRIDAEVAHSVRTLSKEHSVSIPTVLYGAFAALLGRFAGQDEFVLGFVNSGRNQARFASLVGYLVNLLPIAIDISDDPTFLTHVQRTRSAVLAASDHADMPFGRIVESLSCVRGDGGTNGERSQLVTASFAYQDGLGVGEADLAALAINHSAPLGHWGDLEVDSVRVEQRSCYFDLSLYMSEHQGELLGTLEYDADLFDPATMHSLAEALRRILITACDQPDAKVKDLELISVAHSHDMLYGWNDIEAPYSTDPPIHEMFEDAAKRAPEAPALIASNATMTYGELNAAANRLAHRLQRSGVGPEVRVALVMERCAQSIVAILGVFKAGGAYVPIDPSDPPKRQSMMLTNCGAHVVLVSTAKGSELNFDGLVCIDPSAPDLVNERQDNPISSVGPDNAAYVIYTSGSTGKPNGVVGLHRGITNRQRWMMQEFPYAPGEVGCVKTALPFFDSGGEIFWPLVSGAPLVVVDPATGRDPVRLVKLLEEHRVTRLVAVPSLLRSILDCGEDLSSRLGHLKYCHSSGEALHDDVASRFMETLPECTLINLYGSAEVSADVTLEVISAQDPECTIGKPIGNTRIYVLDHDLNPVPSRFEGEICVGGAGLARGYLDCADLTATKFVPDPFSLTGGERLFRTGDRGRFRPDGTLEYLGRVDQQIKIRGFRIEPGEVEAALLAHPGVSEAVVTASAGPHGDMRLVAAVVSLERLDHSQGGTEADRVGEWQRLYEEFYGQVAAEPKRENEMWRSSYTGEPFAAAEMSEWVGEAVARIRAFAPQDVLEIGCGTGNLVMALANDTRKYVATDFSAQAVAFVDSQLQEAGITDQVTVLERPATNVSGLDQKSFDTIVLHSVTQYFPGSEYLVEVIRRIVPLVAPGGRIYLGDVRDLDLLAMFHASVVLGQLPPDATAADAKKRIGQRVAQEEELVVSRGFFEAIAQELADVTHVEFLLKRGRHHNELNGFRYDVILHVGSADGGEGEASPAPVPERFNWSELGSETALRAAIASRRGRPVLVKDVPNARIADAANLAAQLEAAIDDSVISKLGRIVSAVSVDPESIWAMALAIGCHVDIVPSSGAFMDLRFSPRKPTTPLQWEEPGEIAALSPSHTNDPLRGVADRNLLGSIRSHLRQHLPEFMIPVLYIVDCLPRTDTGKVSRQRLKEMTSPSAATPKAKVNRSADSTAMAVVHIWQEVLGIEDINPDENFFDLGGNSLSLVEVHLRLQEFVGHDFELVDLYDHATCKSLVSYVDGLRTSKQVVTNDETAGPSARSERATKLTPRRELLRERRAKEMDSK